MKLIILPEVKQFLKTSKVLTKKDLEHKMHEEFHTYQQKGIVLSTAIKKWKKFSALYETSDDMKNIECIYAHEINTDPNAMTIREYHKRKKKEIRSSKN
ncbi:hypothetical protein [Thermoanaerobacter uzonensis]|uniref:hypothetical protein n=1 Tax=Thermoanaerobacter uzonensis TaxID=447593 RepID=UPI003D768EBD